jgi:hypothetical protein
VYTDGVKSIEMARPRLCVLVTAAALIAGCGGAATTVAPSSVPPVASPTFPLTGVVRELLPGGASGEPLPGARVEVVGKPGVIATALTDGAGAYVIEGMAGTFQLHVVKPGYDDRTVTVSKVTAARTMNVELPPRPRRLTGTARETPPTQTNAVAGARVTITSGSNAGRTATTDVQGQYTLPDVWGDFDLRVERDGYVPTAAHATVAGEDTNLDVRLRPAPRTITQTLVPPAFGGFSISVPVHNDGEIAIIDWSAYGFEEGDTSTLQIWEDGHLIAQTAVERSFPRHTVVLRAAARGGHTYEIRAIVQFFCNTATISYPS